MTAMGDVLTVEHFTAIMERLQDDEIFPDAAKSAWAVIMHPANYFALHVKRWRLWELAQLVYRFGYWLHRKSGAPMPEDWFTFSETP